MRKGFATSFIALLFGLMFSVSAGAQAPQSSLVFNAFMCPEGYGQISECLRLDDVTISVTEDGQEIGPLTSSAAEGVELDLLWGAAISVSVLSGQPDATTLEPTTLAFDAVEGVNPVTLIFVFPLDSGPPPPHSDVNALVVEALVCPVEYAGDNYRADCGPATDVGVTVTRDADDFTVDGVTGADGIVGFQGLGEGTYTVELGVPGDFASFLTVCGTPDGFEPRQVDNPDTNLIGVYLGPQEELTCTFFIIPVDARGEPTPAPTAAPIGALPDTGSGAMVIDAGFSASMLTALSAMLMIVLSGAAFVTGRKA